MAHLLLVESWVGATSFLLPRAITELGHSFTFVTRNLDHYLKAVPDGVHHPLLDADRILTTETNDLAGLVSYIQHQHATLHFDGVLTACDYYLQAAAHIADALNLPGSPPHAVTTASQKHLLRIMLAEAGIPNPDFAIIRTTTEAQAAAQRLGYPCVIKPVDLCAGMFVRAVHSVEDLQQAVKDIAQFAVNARQQPRQPEILLEAYMLGAEVSVETWTCRGETTVIGITDKSITGAPAFIESGHMFPAFIDPKTAAAVCSLVSRSLQAIGYTHGLAHTEVKLTVDGPRVVEINARPGGNYIAELIRHVTGANPLHVMVQLALGETPTWQPQQTGIQSAAVQFLLPPQAGKVHAMSGAELLVNDPDVVDWQIKPVVGTTLRQARDNNDYLGRVMVVDRSGLNARRKAEHAAQRITFTFTDTQVTV